MGIHCEINLNKRADGAYIPGSVVSGTIKYGVDVETVFEKITVSLKGHGFLIIHDQQSNKKGRATHTYRNSEDYVDIDNVVYTRKKEEPLAIGMYEMPFSFKMPEEVPPSLKYIKRRARYRVRCCIEYYLRIKFERPGTFSFNKKFKKEITVVSGIKPRLPMEPIMHGEQKKVFQMFSKNNIINIKATIQNSVISTGGKIEFSYEIVNDTNLTIKGVETKLLELHTFTAYNGKKVEFPKNIADTDSKTGSIPGGEKQTMDTIINVPTERTSLEFSKIVSREYFVQIEVEIPFPHWNAVLKIPVQIGDRIDSIPESLESDEPPPSYWEVMLDEKEKEKGEQEEDNDDDYEEEIEEKS
ncbi:LOW QUALITY PROTEIN: arrestin domain-containing protein 17-like [Aphomia sociella]